MKLTIRKGMFETNSSSMHSIIITKNNNEYTQDELEDGYYNGVLKLWNSDELEFDRYPFELLATWDRKVCFAIASYCGNKYWHSAKYNPEEDDGIEFLENLTKVIKKHISDFERIEIPQDMDKDRDLFPVYGYIDHQSKGLLQKFLAEENISLEEFIDLSNNLEG